MISFIVGCDPGVPGALEEYLRMLEDIEEYDGFVQTLLNREEPWKALVCFETEEQAQTAQWMLDMNGAERREGHGENADAGGCGGDPGLQGYGYSQADHAGDDPHGESAAGDGNGTGRLDQ